MRWLNQLYKQFKYAFPLFNHGSFASRACIPVVMRLPLMALSPARILLHANDYQPAAEGKPEGEMRRVYCRQTGVTQLPWALEASSRRKLNLCFWPSTRIFTRPCMPKRSSDTSSSFFFTLAEHQTGFWFRTYGCVSTLYLRQAPAHSREDVAYQYFNLSPRESK